MFGLGLSEIILIVVVAIIVLGPDKLPNAIIEVAKFFRVIKKTMQDARDTLDKEVNLSELKREADSYKEKLQDSIDITKDVKDVKLIEDIKQDMNDIEHLFSDFEPKIIGKDSNAIKDSITPTPKEVKITESAIKNDINSKDSNITESTINSPPKKRDEKAKVIESIMTDSKELENIESKKPKDSNVTESNMPKKRGRKPKVTESSMTDSKDSKDSKDSNKSKKKLQNLDSKDSKVSNKSKKKLQNLDSKDSKEITESKTDSLASSLRSTLLKQSNPFD